MKFGGNAYHFVIHGRSKERSDAAQTRGSMPGNPKRHYGQEFCSAALRGQGRGMDPRVSATELRSCFALGMTKSRGFGLPELTAITHVTNASASTI
ncbi:MAG: hypothetical protein E5Y02_30460 [Mesorhizobium sp.]|nr:MAG: hypothetical protein E5Y02_30460 [Mesorhizobium sp.]